MSPHPQTDSHSGVFDGILLQVSDLVSGVINMNISAPETDLTRLGVDSLTRLEIMTSLEEHFGITLNENMVREFCTLHEISRIVKEMVRTQ